MTIDDKVRKILFFKVKFGGKAGRDHYFAARDRADVEALLLVVPTAWERVPIRRGDWSYLTGVKYSIPIKNISPDEIRELCRNKGFTNEKLKETGEVLYIIPVAEVPEGDVKKTPYYNAFERTRRLGSDNLFSLGAKLSKQSEE